MKIIAISGKAQHGKDTTANMLKASLEKTGQSVLIFHNADLLKHLCRSYFGWNGVKDDTGRALLQRVGTNIVRGRDSDFWVDFAKRFLALFPGEWDYVLIPDSRFPNEVDWVDFHLRVVRQNFQSPLSAEQQQHESETALDEFLADIWLYNDGTLQELEDKIQQVAREVMK